MKRASALPNFSDPRPEDIGSYQRVRHFGSTFARHTNKKQNFTEIMGKTSFYFYDGATTRDAPCQPRVPQYSCHVRPGPAFGNFQHNDGPKDRGTGDLYSETFQSSRESTTTAEVIVVKKQQQVSAMGRAPPEFLCFAMVCGVFSMCTTRVLRRLILSITGTWTEYSRKSAPAFIFGNVGCGAELYTAATERSPRGPREIHTARMDERSV